MSYKTPYVLNPVCFVFYVNLDRVFVWNQFIFSTTNIYCNSTEAGQSQLVIAVSSLLMRFNTYGWLDLLVVGILSNFWTCVWSLWTKHRPNTPCGVLYYQRLTCVCAPHSSCCTVPRSLGKPQVISWPCSLSLLEFFS